MTKEKKPIGEAKPYVVTLQDKGAKIDYVDFGNGNRTYIFEEEKFTGVKIFGFSLGWSKKYKVISPQELTKGTLTVMSTLVTSASRVTTSPEDFSVSVKEPEEE